MLLTILAATAALSANATREACPPGMAAFSRFCMDEFEAPNEKGVHPLVAQNAYEGERWCKAHGDKRLCTEGEWVQACKGEAARAFPYGARHEAHRCNDDKEWIMPNWRLISKYPAPEGKAEVERLYQGEASGSRPGCSTPEGVYDLTGNLAEWTRRTFDNRNNYDHVMKGCYWAKCYGGAWPNCEFVNPAHPGTFRTYEAGFRCCKSR
jgi:formylglycine-generating enzyme required for sulfatase activity